MAERDTTTSTRGDKEEEVLIDYTNWRGERTIRRIRPVQILFGWSQHHPEPQWLLDAIDVEKNEPRTFAMASIHSWEVIS